MDIATASPPRPSPAAVEFALLQSWLSASTTLQLPLHAIESQQSDKGREVQRLLLQAHLEQRGDGDVGSALLVQSGDRLARRRGRPGHSPPESSPHTLAHALGLNRGCDGARGATVDQNVGLPGLGRQGRREGYDNQGKRTTELRHDRAPDSDVTPHRGETSLAAGRDSSDKSPGTFPLRLGRLPH